jgi:hypothetical protein
MQVVSTSPLRVGSVVWQPWPRVWALSIVCKATFLLAPGTSQLADVQEELFDNDRYWDDDTQRSLYAPNDLVPLKQRADVLLVGHAFAVGGRPVRSLVARFVVGDVDKRIEVWCDRVFWHRGQILEAQPFTKMPLRYERAAGGPGTINPVGMRHDASPDAHGAVRIPNLLAVGAAVRPGEAIAPVGFGPIAPTWPGRLEKSAGHAGVRWSERALPQGMDHGYFGAAPWDQQVAGIRPDERIVLENLHPVYETLETRLPGVVPRALVQGPAREEGSVPLVADTLWIDTDRGIATVVWRGRIGLTDPAEAGEVVVGMEGGNYLEADSAIETVFVQVSAKPAADKVLPFGDAKSLWAGYQGPALKPEHKGTGTLCGVRAPVRDVLPFVEGLKVELWPPAPPPLAEEAPAPTEEAKTEVVEEGAPEDEEVVAKPVEESDDDDDDDLLEKPRPDEPEVSLEEFPIERYAALSAAIDKHPADKARMLEENRISVGQWESLTRRWDEAIDAEIERGEMELLRAFDGAYVGQIEKERGVITPEEYSRLEMAAERGTTEKVLAELGIPEEAEMRVERVWMGKSIFAEVT